MADALAKDVLDTAVNPPDVARQKFDLERRGFDQAQVRAYLIAVSEALRDAQQREAEIRTRLGKAIRRAETAEAALRESKAEDPAALSRQVGDEVTAVLDAARVAGEQKISAAEKSAEQLMGNAKAEATRIRRAAETILDERKAEADKVAEEMLSARQAEADKLIATARADAETLRRDAAADISRVRDECDGLIREAEEARAQILQDMERRRRQARAQVERLRVGRDRLLRSYEVVRRTLDESTGELKASLHEAKVLGDTAARSVAAEPLREPAQLEAELADAKLIGRGPRSAPERSKPRSSTPSSRSRSADAGAPGTRKATDAAPSRGRAGAEPAADEVRVPHVDMRPGSSGSAAAPTPRRPVARDTAVPKPPTVAPLIKAPEAEAVPSPPSAAKAAPAARNEADAKPIEAETRPGATAQLVVVEPEPDSEVSGAENADPIVDHAAGDAAVAVPADEAGVDASGVDEDFSDLPSAEWAIIEASDEIEEVIALMLPSVDLGDADDGSAEHPADDGSAAVEPVSAKVVVDVEAPSTDVPADASAASTETTTEAAGASSGLFAALRAQSSKPVPVASDGGEASEPVVNEAVPAESAAEATEATEAAEDAADAPGEAEPVIDVDAAEEMARQRRAVVAEVAVDLAKRLKRALADEQNEVLAGIRAAGKNDVELISLVGETDDHVQRYVVAIHEVAANAFAAGAALVDAEPIEGEMPAGAVEEILGSAVVLPLRLRLIELDSVAVEHVSVHVDALRAFYRQRKTDHLSEAAETLAGLLVTSGACKGLPADARLPWLVGV